MDTELRQIQSQLRQTYYNIRKVTAVTKRALSVLGQKVEINDNNIDLTVDFRLNRIGRFLYSRIINKRGKYRKVTRVYLCEPCNSNPLIGIIIERHVSKNGKLTIYCFNLCDRPIRILLTGKKFILLTIYPLEWNLRPTVENVDGKEVITVGFDYNVDNKRFRRTSGSRKNVETLMKLSIMLKKLIIYKAKLLVRLSKNKYGIYPSTVRLINYGRLRPAFMLYRDISRNVELLEKLRQYERERVTRIFGRLSIPSRRT